MLKDIQLNNFLCSALVDNNGEPDDPKYDIVGSVLDGVLGEGDSMLWFNEVGPYTVYPVYIANIDAVDFRYYTHGFMLIDLMVYFIGLSNSLGVGLSYESYADLNDYHG